MTFDYSFLPVDETDSSNDMPESGTTDSDTTGSVVIAPSHTEDLITVSMLQNFLSKLSQTEGDNLLSVSFVSISDSHPVGHTLLFESQELLQKQLQHIGYGLFLDQSVTLQFQTPLTPSRCFQLYSLKRNYFNSAVHIHFDTINMESFLLYGTFLLLFLMAILELCLLRERRADSLNRRLLEQQVRLYEQEFQAIRHSHDQIHSLRHDWSNHLLLLSEYIHDEKYAKAEDYISKLTETIHATYNYSNTGNYDVDCILNYYLAKAEASGCHLTLSLSLPPQLFLSGFDLNVLLSNLLENALEALSHCSQKELDICLKYEKNLFYISIYNTFQTPLYPENKVFQTTKKDRTLHGYGFQNMTAIIDKYEGTFSFQTKGNLFMADIILAE
jgi:signal transduction histidine kinase